MKSMEVPVYVMEVKKFGKWSLLWKWNFINRWQLHET